MIFFPEINITSILYSVSFSGGKNNVKIIIILSYFFRMIIKWFLCTICIIAQWCMFNSIQTSYIHFATLAHFYFIVVLVQHSGTRMRPCVSEFCGLGFKPDLQPSCAEWRADFDPPPSPHSPFSQRSQVAGSSAILHSETRTLEGDLC